jgi:hypothetical protein
MAFFIASIVFLVGFVAFIFSHVIFEQEMGGIYSICTFPMVLFLTVITFLKIHKKKKKTVRIVTLASSDISKYAQKDFTKVFTQTYLKEAGIICVYITSAKLNSYDYSLLIHSHDYKNIDQVNLNNKLKKRFYDVSRIKILAFNNQPINNLFKIQIINEDES